MRDIDTNKGISTGPPAHDTKEAHAVCTHKQLKLP